MQIIARVLPLMLGACLVTGVATARPNVKPKSASHKPTGIVWQSSFDKALRAAQKSKQPMLVYFHASWCGPCKEMDDKVLTDARIVDATKKWVSLRADMDEETALAVRLKVDRPPTIVFLNAKGQIVSQADGYQSVSELLKALKAAHAKASGAKKRS